MPSYRKHTDEIICINKRSGTNEIARRSNGHYNGVREEIN